MSPWRLKLNGVLAFFRVRKYHTNIIRVLQVRDSGIQLCNWALDPDRGILMLMWSFGPLFLSSGCR